MKWKEMRNGESKRNSTTNSGVCKFSGEQAEVTSLFSGTMECKTDLQQTYRFIGYKCSLQEEKVFPNPACMDERSLIQIEHL